MHEFFVCNHVTFHQNDGQSNNLWQEKLNGNSSFESLTVSKLDQYIKIAVFVIIPVRQLKSQNYVLQTKNTKEIPNEVCDVTLSVHPHRAS
jgi:hypothetical protein